MPSLMGAKHADVMKAMPARIKAVVHVNRVEAAAPLVAWAAQECRRHGSVLESVLIDTRRTAQVAPRVEFNSGPSVGATSRPSPVSLREGERHRVLPTPGK